VPLTGNNNCLTSLDVSCNRLGLEGIEQLATALRSNHSIVCLDLRNNTREAAKEDKESGREERILMDVLRENITLGQLHYGEDELFLNQSRKGGAPQSTVMFSNVIQTYLDDNRRRRVRKERVTASLAHKDEIDEPDETDEMISVEMMLLDRGDEESSRYQTIDLSCYSLSSNAVAHVIARELNVKQSGHGRKDDASAALSPSSTLLSPRFPPSVNTTTSASSSLVSSSASASPSSSSSSSTPPSSTSSLASPAPSWVWKSTPSLLSNSRLTSTHTDQSLLFEKVLLSGNRLTSVPVSGFEPGSERWENLTSLDLSSNRLSSLPAALGDIASLRVLDLRFNRLQSLPPEIGKLKVGILVTHFTAAAVSTNVRTHRSCESCT
jgi:hypothetical protein